MYVYIGINNKFNVSDGIAREARTRYVTCKHYNNFSSDFRVENNYIEGNGNSKSFLAIRSLSKINCTVENLYIYVYICTHPCICLFFSFPEEQRGGRKSSA